MRDIPTPLAAHLAEGVTTLCRCWKLTRRDGVVLGFSDHDRDLVVDGTTYTAGSAFEAADASSELGFAVGGGEVSGGLSSDDITEADILAGLYDDASVEVRLVNWVEPVQNLVLNRASIGEIRRGDGSFTAELRGPMHRFDEEQGRIYRAACSADLGDARCRVDLDQPTFALDGSVRETDGALELVSDGLAGWPDGWFTGGRLAWTGGLNDAQSVEVRAHSAATGGGLLQLWQRMPAAIAPGDGFRVRAGCDKTLATCGAKFANVANHRGFPHMPGNDFIVRLARQGEAGLDGGSLFR